jgi:Concanavalin A-like lectin/glucanases superfamily
LDTNDGDKGAELVGGPTFTATGRIAGAVVLNAGQYIKLPVDVVKSMDYMTVAAWVKLSSNSSGTLFDFGTAGDNHFYLRLGGGSGVTYGAQILGGAIHETATTYLMPTNVWKHVALTVGDGKASLYIDGLNVRTTANFTVSPSGLGSTAGNYIGHTNTDTSSFYGNVDDFRIYPRVLTREELENLAFPGKDYIHFRFDEPCGTKAYDRSDNSVVAELPEGGSWTSNGHVGGGLTLNGANQFVKLPNNFLQACNDLTIAMWVQRASSTTAFERLFAFGQDTKTVMTLTTAAGANPMQFSAKLNASDVRGLGEEQLLSTAPELSPKRGIWSHLAVVLKSGSTSTMYFDGNVAATNTFTIKPSDMGSTVINTLGRPVYAGEPFYTGIIDDLRVACRAFTAPEIKILALGNSN